MPCLHLSSPLHTAFVMFCIGFYPHSYESKVYFSPSVTEKHTRSLINHGSRRWLRQVLHRNQNTHLHKAFAMFCIEFYPHFYESKV
jgi:hypothetical protein